MLISNTNNLREDLSKLIINSKNILIVSHKKPDADAIASCCALFYWINKTLNKKASIKISNKKISTFDYIPYSDQVEYVEDINSSIKNFDLVIFIDSTEYKRFSYESIYNKPKDQYTVVIDHHVVSKEMEKTLSNIDLYYISPDLVYSSASEILALEVFSEDEIDAKLGEILLQGIIGDTNGLSYIGVKQNLDSLTTVKMLIERTHLAQLDILTLKAATINLKALPVFAKLVENTKVHTFNNSYPPFTYTYVDKDYLELYGEVMLKEARAYYIDMFLRKIKNSPWGIILTYKNEEKGFDVSMRTIPDVFSVQELCLNLFSGGGHIYASGGELPKLNKSESAEKAVLRAIKMIEKYLTENLNKN